MTDQSNQNADYLGAAKQTNEFEEKKARAWHFWVGGTMLFIILLSLNVWYFTREILPKEFLIATASEGGQYYEFGGKFGNVLKNQTNRKVKLLTSMGSVDNNTKLILGEAHLAIMQSGVITESSDLRALAPLYYEPVHVVVRRDSNIKTIRDLSGRAVSIGPEGSGMRITATNILNHYRVDPNSLKKNYKYFKELEKDPDLDAAVITTGLLNPDLRALLSSGEFRLVPLMDSEALSIHHPYFKPVHIPRGFYCEGPAVPAEDMHTVATTAYLAAKEDADAILVQAAMRALYEDFLMYDIPVLIPKIEGKAWNVEPRHSAAEAYYNPYQGLDLLATMLESMAATKELFFALGAGLYLLWNLFVWRREKQERELIHRLKSHLDKLLFETVEIERLQRSTQDPDDLKGFLDQVTDIKIKALVDLADTELRGDRSFVIFLLQCSGLIQKLQTKLEMNSKK